MEGASGRGNAMGGGEAQTDWWSQAIRSASIFTGIPMTLLLGSSLRAVVVVRAWRETGLSLRIPCQDVEDFFVRS